MSVHVVAGRPQQLLDLVAEYKAIPDPSEQQAAGLAQVYVQLGQLYEEFLEDGTVERVALDVMAEHARRTFSPDRDAAAEMAREIAERLGARRAA